MLQSDAQSRLANVVRDVVRPAAEAVDQGARYPVEALEELKKEGLLAAAVPVECGGLGSSISELSAMCTLLARGCASTAMIFAMHQIQVACIVRHGGDAGFPRAFLRRAAEEQLLIASATSEAGVGGDLRQSIAALELKPQGFSVDKSCSTVSYGEYADAILLTARRDPTAGPSDQSLALVTKRQFELEKLGTWDTLGMRGTCSPPLRLRAEAPAEQILPASMHEVAAETMVPHSHILWASCWLGIAADAVRIARSHVGREARRRPGVSPLGSNRLAEAMVSLQCFQALVSEVAREYEIASAGDGRAALASPAFRIRMNNLKLAASRWVGEICMQCLAACGAAGYSNAGPSTLCRHLRDALSAPLMISNERLLTTNASLGLVSSGSLLGAASAAGLG